MKNTWFSYKHEERKVYQTLKNFFLFHRRSLESCFGFKGSFRESGFDTTYNLQMSRKHYFTLAWRLFFFITFNNVVQLLCKQLTPFTHKTLCQKVYWETFLISMYTYFCVHKTRNFLRNKRKFVVINSSDVIYIWKEEE